MRRLLVCLSSKVQNRFQQTYCYFHLQNYTFVILTIATFINLNFKFFIFYYLLILLISWYSFFKFLYEFRSHDLKTLLIFYWLGYFWSHFFQIGINLISFFWVLKLKSASYSFTLTLVGSALTHLMTIFILSTTMRTSLNFIISGRVSNLSF